MEWSTIHDDVCVLTITGTAATVRGLPNLAHAQRMWAEWELRQSAIIDNGGESGGSGGITRNNAYLPGDSSPGSVISTNEVTTPYSDTPFSNTPFSGGESEDNGGEERGGHDDKEEVAEERVDDVVNGHLRIDGSSTGHVPFNNLSRREIKDAQLTRIAQRLERRMKRLGVGKGANIKRSGRGGEQGGVTMDMSSRDVRDIVDRSGFVSVLPTARLARPCSYCHVPYHHRLAPFTNMKLV